MCMYAAGCIHMCHNMDHARVSACICLSARRHCDDRTGSCSMGGRSDCATWMMEAPCSSGAVAPDTESATPTSDCAHSPLSIGSSNVQYPSSPGGGGAIGTVSNRAVLSIAAEVRAWSHKRTWQVSCEGMSVCVHTYPCNEGEGAEAGEWGARITSGSYH